LAHIMACTDRASRVGQNALNNLRSSPGARALQVLADPKRPDERFWAVENHLFMRSNLLGYGALRVNIVTPESLNKELAADLSRWQQLRSRAAQLPRSPEKQEIVRKLIHTAVRYRHKDDDDVMGYGHMMVEFCRIPVTKTSRPRKAANTNELMWHTIGELEAELMPLIDAAPTKPNRPSFENNPKVKSQGDIVSDVCTNRDDTCSVSSSLEPFDCNAAGLCVYCLEQDAEMVMRGCGHLVFCATCRKRVVGHTLRATGVRSLTITELNKTKVPCPICRKTSFMMRRHEFKKTVYKP